MKIEQLYKDIEIYDIPKDALENLNDLLAKMNMLEAAVGFALTVDRAFSTWVQHLAIYTALNAARSPAKKLPVPMHSVHLIGMGIDLSDPQKILQTFLADEMFLTDNGLWAEGFQWTGDRDYIHLQTKSYGSWKLGASRFYRPY